LLPHDAADSTARPKSDTAVQTDPITPRQPPSDGKSGTSKSFVGNQAFAIRRLAQQNIELNAKLRQERTEKGESFAKSRVELFSLILMPTLNLAELLAELQRLLIDKS